MRQIVFFICFLLFSTGILSAESIQKVRVLEYKGADKKTPLANVEVIVGNAGSAVTDKRGQCKLQFRTLRPGDKVTVRRIVKPGYELLNPLALDQWYISKDTDETYEILMVSSKRISAERENYMQAAMTSVERSMATRQLEIDEQLSKKEISKPEYDKKLKMLQEEYNTKLDNIDNYIDHIVHTDISKISDKEKEILDLVKAGDIDSALAGYNEMNLLDTYKTEIADRKQLEMASSRVKNEKLKIEDGSLDLYRSVLRQNDFYRIVGGKENIEAGLKLWHDFAFTDTTFCLPLFEYAKYCEKSMRVDEALEALKYCLQAPDTVMQMRAKLLNIQILTKKNQYDRILPNLESIYSYMDSMSMARNDSTLYLPERAYALDILCTTYSYLRDAEKSKATRQLMVDTNLKAYEWDKSNMEQKRLYVNALYDAHRSVYAIETAGGTKNIEAFKTYDYLDQAIVLQEELYRFDPVKQSAMYAFLIKEKAMVMRKFAIDTSVVNEIKNEYQLAIKLFDEAYEHNPRAYAHHVATTTFDYAGFLADFNVGDKDTIMSLFAKAREYENQVFEYNPNANQRTLCYILWGTGKKASDFGEYDLAERSLLEALETLQPLYLRYPKTYQALLNTIYKSLSNLYSEERMNNPAKYADYRKKYEEAQAAK